MEEGVMWRGWLNIYIGSLVGGSTAEIQISTFHAIPFISYYIAINFLNVVPFVKDRSFTLT